MGLKDILINKIACPVLDASEELMNKVQDLNLDKIFGQYVAENEAKKIKFENNLCITRKDYLLKKEFEIMDSTKKSNCIIKRNIFDWILAKSKLYDLNNHHLCTVYRKFNGLKRSNDFVLKYNDTELLMNRIDSKKFIGLNNNLSISINKKYTEFTVFKGEGECIVKIKGAENSNSYVVEYLNSEDKFISLMIFMLIELAGGKK